MNWRGVLLRFLTIVLVLMFGAVVTQAQALGPQDQILCDIHW